MSAVLGLVVLSAAYTVPPALGIYWRNATSWVGKTALTWAFVSVVYDIAVVRDRDFEARDAAVTFLATVLYRGLRNRVM